MPTRFIRPRLLDILRSIDVVSNAITDRNYASFLSDIILQLAVERSIEIVSEAVRHIPDQDRQRYPDVPWRNIIAIGNKLRHEYHRVDPDIVWGIAFIHLPTLRPVIAALLQRYPEERE